MDLSKNELIRKVISKWRGAEIFSNFRPLPILRDKILRHLVQLLAIMIPNANAAMKIHRTVG